MPIAGKRIKPPVPHTGVAAKFAADPHKAPKLTAVANAVKNATQSTTPVVKS